MFCLFNISNSESCANASVCDLPGEDFPSETRKLAGIPNHSQRLITNCKPPMTIDWSCCALNSAPWSTNMLCGKSSAILTELQPTAWSDLSTGRSFQRPTATEAPGSSSVTERAMSSCKWCSPKAVPGAASAFKGWEGWGPSVSSSISSISSMADKNLVLPVSAKDNKSSGSSSKSEVHDTSILDLLHGFFALIVPMLAPVPMAGVDARVSKCSLSKRTLQDTMPKKEKP